MIGAGDRPAYENRHDMHTPEVLYKFLSAERTIDALPELSDGTLRATQPGALNDPFECATFCEEAIYSGQDRAWNSLTKKELSSRIGIISLSNSPLDLRLWTHYADEGRGIAIGYHGPTLREHVRGRGHLGPIEYWDMRDGKPTFIISEDEWSLYKQLYFKKGNVWIHENEWRIIVQLEDTIDTGKFDRTMHSINLLSIPNEAVVQLYYTERTDKHLIKKLETRLKNPENRYGTDLAQQLVKHHLEYKYTTSDPHN